MKIYIVNTKDLTTEQSNDLWMAFIANNDGFYNLNMKDPKYILREDPSWWFESNGVPIEGRIKCIEIDA